MDRATLAASGEEEDISDVAYYLAHHKMHHVAVEEEKSFLAAVKKRKRSISVDDLTFAEVKWEPPAIPAGPLRQDWKYNYRSTGTWKTPKSLIKVVVRNESQRKRPKYSPSAERSVSLTGRKRTPSLKQRQRNEMGREQATLQVTAKVAKGMATVRKRKKKGAKEAAARTPATTPLQQQQVTTPTASDTQMKLLKKLQYLQLRRQLALLQRSNIVSAGPGLARDSNHFPHISPTTLASLQALRGPPRNSRKR